MRTLKPLAAALAAAGLVAVPNSALALTSQEILDAMCAGGPVTSLNCSGDSLTLPKACLIKVPAGSVFSIAECVVSGNELYPMTIKGSGNASVSLINGQFSNAPKFELDFGIGGGNACGAAINVDWRISADKVDIHANGGVRVDTQYEPPVPGFKGEVVADSISVKSKFGDVCVTIGPTDTSNGLRADKIEIKSDFGNTAIGGVPLPP